LLAVHGAPSRDGFLDLFSRRLFDRLW